MYDRVDGRLARSRPRWATNTCLGSVTASPCTEGIAWYILKTPREVSAAQIKAFAKLYSHDVRAVTAAQWPHRQRIPVIADP